MLVGYVPDQFGHIAQLPQILQGASIDTAVLWRGVGSQCRDTQFIWEAPDGSRIETFYLIDSYSNAAGPVSYTHLGAPRGRGRRKDRPDG